MTDEIVSQSLKTQSHIPVKLNLWTNIDIRHCMSGWLPMLLDLLHLLSYCARCNHRLFQSQTHTMRQFQNCVLKPYQVEINTSNALFLNEFMLTDVRMNFNSLFILSIIYIKQKTDVRFQYLHKKSFSNGQSKQIQVIWTQNNL